MMIFAHLLLILEEKMMPNLDQKPWQKRSDTTTTLLKQISSGDVDDSLNKVSSICESPFDDTSVIPSHIVFSSVKKSDIQSL